MKADEYSDLIRNVQINRVLLHTCSCRRLWDIDGLPKSPTITFALKPRLAGVDESGFTALATFRVSAEQLGPSSDAGQQVMDIRATFALRYEVKGKWLSSIPEDRRKRLLTTFVRRNVPINVWPYGREIIASLTTRMDFPAVVLPVQRSMPKKSQ